MNTHLQLLWNSVFAPRAAVDLARQHPNTNQLGWLYVVATIAAAFSAEILFRNVVRPIFDVVTEGTNDPWAWIDTVFGSTMLSIIATVAFYVVQRWFWRKFADKSISQSAIDAAIIAGLALSLVLLLPQFIVSELTLNSNWKITLVDLMVQVAIYIGFSTVYVSHALSVSFAKSFWLNCLVFVLIMMFSIGIFFSFFVVMALLSGMTLETLFPVEGTPQ